MDVSTVCLSVHQSPKMPIYHRYVVPWNISNRFQWHSSWSHWIQSNAITVDSTFQSTVDDQMKINGNSSSSIQRDIKDRSIHPVSIHSLSLPSFIRPSFVRPSVPIFSLSLLFFFFFYNFYYIWRIVSGLNSKLDWGEFISNQKVWLGQTRSRAWVYRSA